MERIIIEQEKKNCLGAYICPGKKAFQEPLFILHHKITINASLVQKKKQLHFKKIKIAIVLELSHLPRKIELSRHHRS